MVLTLSLLCQNGKILPLPIGPEDLASDGICLPARIGTAHEDSLFTIDDNPLSATTDCRPIRKDFDLMPLGFEPFDDCCGKATFDKQPVSGVASPPGTLDGLLNIGLKVYDIDDDLEKGLRLAIGTWRAQNHEGALSH